MPTKRFWRAWVLIEKFSIFFIFASNSSNTWIVVFSFWNEKKKVENFDLCLSACVNRKHREFSLLFFLLSSIHSYDHIFIKWKQELTLNLAKMIPILQSPGFSFIKRKENSPDLLQWYLLWWFNFRLPTASNFVHLISLIAYETGQVIRQLYW